MGIDMRLYLMCMTMLAAAWVDLSAALAEPPEGTPQTQKAPEVFALDAGGRMLTGRLATADLAGSIQLACDGKPVIVSSADVIWLGVDARMRSDPRPLPWFAEEPLQGRAAPKPPPVVRVLLRDGQVLEGTPGEEAVDTLVLEHSLLGRLALPFGQLRQVRFGRGSADWFSRKAAAWRQDGSLDVVLMTNDDRLEGIVRMIGPKQIVLESAAGDRKELPSDSVGVVQLAEVPAPAIASAPASQSQRSRRAEAWLRLRSGEAIRVQDVGYSPAGATVTFARQGRPGTIPLAELIGIEPVSPRWQWLTAIRPSRYEHRPLLCPTLMWQVDTTCTGLPVCCAGQAVPHGIGAPVGSTLRYNLDGSWRSLIVRPVLDDSAGKVGACTAVIRVDGREVWKRSIRAKAMQVAFIDLSGKRELSLEVEPAQAGDVLGRFAWAWGALVKEGPQ
jgi:hypothetical protein